ncbi:MAG: hypothetical protein WBC91_26725, partial [Phototrophicaceae bacterium]
QKGIYMPLLEVDVLVIEQIIIFFFLVIAIVMWIGNQLPIIEGRSSAAEQDVASLQAWLNRVHVVLFCAEIVS